MTMPRTVHTVFRIQHGGIHLTRANLLWCVLLRLAHCQASPVPMTDHHVPRSGRSTLTKLFLSQESNMPAFHRCSCQSPQDQWMLDLIQIRNITSLLSFDDRIDCHPSVGQAETLPRDRSESIAALGIRRGRVPGPFSCFADPLTSVEAFRIRIPC
jgi:hypothetical protein